MGFFDFKNDRQKVELTTNTPQDGSVNIPYAFSTPFMKIGKGNLSLPYINKQYMINGSVPFGENNLYPQLLDQMYYTSPMHGALIEFKSNSIIGGGYSLLKEPSTLPAKERVDWLTFERKNKFTKMSRLITRNYMIHNRVCVIVYRNEKGELLKLKRVEPATIRNNADCTEFQYSPDWSKGTVHAKTFKRYDGVCTDKETLYVYQDESPGQDIYPIPQYNSILNWCALSGEIAFFQKQNIQNGIFPSLVVRRPKEFLGDKDMLKFQKEFSMGKGPEGGGSVMVVTGNGFDDTPEVIPIQANNNDKMFELTLRDLNGEIAKGHKVDPALAGISVSGSLGNTEQMEIAYGIYDKDVVLPNREIIEEILNDLLEIGDIKNKLIINDFKLRFEVDGVVSEETTDTASVEPLVANDAESEARAQLRGSVGGVQGIIQIQTSVAQGLTDRGSAAALLELIYGFAPTEALRLLGDVKEGQNVEEPVKEVGKEETELEGDSTTDVVVNDALKGLSAAENSDIYRIIRDHSKGRMPDMMAITRLKAYGLTDKEAREILGLEN